MQLPQRVRPTQRFHVEAEHAGQQFCRVPDTGDVFGGIRRDRGQSGGHLGRIGDAGPGPECVRRQPRIVQTQHRGRQSDAAGHRLPGLAVPDAGQRELLGSASYLAFVLLQHRLVVADPNDETQRGQVERLVFADAVRPQLVGGQDVVLAQELILQSGQIFHAGFDVGRCTEQARQAGRELEISASCGRCRQIRIAARLGQHHGARHAMVDPIVRRAGEQLAVDLDRFPVHAQQTGRDVRRGTGRPRQEQNAGKQYPLRIEPSAVPPCRNPPPPHQPHPHRIVRVTGSVPSHAAGEKKAVTYKMLLELSPAQTPCSPDPKPFDLSTSSETAGSPAALKVPHTQRTEGTNLAARGVRSLEDMPHNGLWEGWRRGEKSFALSTHDIAGSETFPSLSSLSLQCVELVETSKRTPKSPQPSHLTPALGRLEPAERQKGMKMG